MNQRNGLAAIMVCFSSFKQFYALTFTIDSRSGPDFGMGGWMSGGSPETSFWDVVRDRRGRSLLDPE
jgi:hypothetical protein